MSRRILEKKQLGPCIWEYLIEAPDIAKAARAGQFVIVRLHEKGERIPLTIVETEQAVGGVRLVVQEVGKTTCEMVAGFDAGDALLDFVGPLGEPSEIARYGVTVCIGGGVGIAPLYPIARELKAAGNRVIAVLGARSADCLFYEKEFADLCDAVHIVTDDGSRGESGFTSDVLGRLLDTGEKIDRVWAIGPPIMMKVCADVTRPHGIPTVVSLNPIMVDGTGMCGGCRVEVGGKTRFACVDGPEFDGHQVDFDGLMARLRFYTRSETRLLDEHELQPCTRKQEEAW